ncbi:DIRP domain [Arabidopsis thaliana x Arabidopsis arenosa]|uniref:DIRP domain n=2 Tax=Arabidopsis thaliana x Arabidopsis arenosa TaxID=1240361 RepID=A0A8T1YZV6_9BRAS|nr:DIRP domain [Arabidopsis thaliana x Arabidopsis arenosa]
MAPSRKSKSVNKRFTNEASPDINGGSASKTKQRKKKLADKLGPQWTKGELARFYDAYRKNVGDWKKVAAAVRNNRSVEMVEALFSMNRAYLSLPEGTASVAGLIAMMTDHYSVMEGSESEVEDHDASEVPRKHLKRKRPQVRPIDFREEVIPPHSVASVEGCLSLLKQTQAYEKRRRATGKRTPRFLVAITHESDDRADSSPPNKRAKKQLDADDDASRRGGGSPYRRTELSDSTQTRLRKMLQAQEAQFKHPDSTMFENGVRTSRDRRQKKGAADRDGALLRDMEGLVTKKGKNVRIEEAEGNDSEDDDDGLGALKALAEMSASLAPAALMESELSPLWQEERIANNVDEKSNTLETVSTSHHREKAKEAGPEASLLLAISAPGKRKPKSVPESVDGNVVSVEELGTSRRKRKPKFQVLDVEAPKESIQEKFLYTKESAEDDNLKTLVKARRSGQGPAKQLKTAKTSEESSLASDKKLTIPDAVVPATQVSALGPATLPQKPPNRRKMSLKKSLQERAKSLETTHDKLRSRKSLSEHELLKEKFSNCLSYPLVRRWCIYEWFYSAIDYPWFAKMEFTDYLNHVGLGHAPRLTRVEWSVIKSSLGRPRRLSERFLHDERDKLQQYRESVRKHYTELRGCATGVLHTDLARPLSVGNRVIAIHPKTREIRDGKILTVDHNKCNVLFDELGVELVKDIDCMPLNPLEYMPEGLRRQIDKCVAIGKEAQLNRHPSSDASLLFSPSVLENVKFSMNPPAKQDDIREPVLHSKVLATNTTDQSIATNSKVRGPEIQWTLTPQHTSDAQEMEPEMIEIASESKSIAQAMVDAAMKAASSGKNNEDSGNMVHQASSIGEHQPLYSSIVPGIKHQEHTNGSLDHYPSNTAEPMTNGFISQDGSGKNKTQMPSELITSCVASWLMMQMISQKQYPPEDVAQLMDTAVSDLQPRCPQNMPIYREIQTYMGLIKTQIMALVRT